MGVIIAQLGFKNTVYHHSKSSRNEFAMSSGKKVCAHVGDRDKIVRAFEKGEGDTCFMGSDDKTNKQ